MQKHIKLLQLLHNKTYKIKNTTNRKNCTLEYNTGIKTENMFNAIIPLVY